MTDINTLFTRKKADFTKLLAFGFSEQGGVYTFSTSLFDSQFEMRTTVTPAGKLSTEVIEKASGESYALHRVPQAMGAFVGRVREEYAGVLHSIAEACFEPDVFKSAGAKLVTHYVKEKYQNDLEFLWERFPDNAIVRRQDSAKWYAIVMTVQKKKLGLSGEGSVEILDLRMKPEDIAALVDGKRYFPGYHMNKKHWFSICLDDTAVPIEEIFFRIDQSFALATK